MYRDNDSVSIFGPALGSTCSSRFPSTTFTTRIVTNSGASINSAMEITIEMNDDSNKEVSKFSDAVSKISNLEMQFATFNAYLNEINRTAQKEASKNSKALKDILALLQGGGMSNKPTKLPVPSAQANQQSSDRLESEGRVEIQLRGQEGDTGKYMDLGTY